MKYFLSVLVLGVSINAMALNCKSLIAEVKKDINTLGKLIDSSADVRKTKSDVQRDMVRELAENEDVTYQWNQTFVPEDWNVAGTVTRKGAYDVVLNTAETWYSEDKDGNNQLPQIKKALFQALSHEEVKYGFDTGVQGWGGSPANHLMFLIPECKTNIILFLGITHD